MQALHAVAKEHLFEHAILTIPLTASFFDIIAEDASLGEKSQNLRSKVKSLCFRLPPPPADSHDYWDITPWRGERSRMAEDASRSKSRLEEAESHLLPNLKVVTISGQNAQWWQRQEPFVLPTELRDQLQMTNTFIRRLVSSLGPEGEVREHGCSGPFSLCVPSRPSETPYRFDGVYTAHVDDITAFNKSERQLTWPSTTPHFIVHEQEGEASHVVMFSAFLLTLYRNSKYSGSTTPNNITIWGPYRKDHPRDENGKPTDDPSKIVTVESLQEDARALTDTRWRDIVTCHYLEDAPGWPFDGQRQSSFVESTQEGL
jgi:hypothetical protein